MTDEQMLQSMQMMLAETKKEILREVRDALGSQLNAFNAVIEEKVTKEIRVIAEGHSILLQRLPEENELPELKSRVRILERIVQEHDVAINELKQA